MKVPARVWNDVLTQLLTVDLRRDLRGIKARTLILWGDKDGVSTRADQATLFQEIPNATLKVYESIGHAVHWEAPDRVAADLAAFLVRGDQVSRRLEPVARRLRYTLSPLPSAARRRLAARARWGGAHEQTHGSPAVRVDRRGSRGSRHARDGRRTGARDRGPRC